jgi:hypothetical protein
MDRLDCTPDLRHGGRRKRKDRGKRGGKREERGEKRRRSEGQPERAIIPLC